MASGPGRGRGGIRIQEPGNRHRDESKAAAAAAAAAVAEPTPPAPPSDGFQEWPHGPPGAEGGSPSAAADARKGKGVLAPSPLPSPSRSEGTSSPVSSDIISDKGPGESSSTNTLANGDRRLGVSWRNPLLETTMEVPKVTRPMDVKSAFDNLSLEQQWALAEEMEMQQCQQVQQRKSLLNKFKGCMANMFFERIGRQMHNSNPDSTVIIPHVNHQKIHITKIIRHYNLLEVVAGQGVESRSHALNLRLAYSEFRPVLGDGECFYRSFIFSYLEQVLDRPDTHEEHRLLAAVKEVARQHARLGWATEFSRSQKVFKKLIMKVIRWKRRKRQKHVPTSSSYCIMKLLDFFRDYERTDDIFTFLRLIVAIWICSHSEEFVRLIPEVNEDYTLTDWCFKEVIQRRVFSDHVQIIALLMALGVPLRVEYLTGQPGQDLYAVQDHKVPRIRLLYGVEHYDILYPRRDDDEGAESSSQQISKEDTFGGANLGDRGGVRSWIESAGICLPSSKIIQSGYGGSSSVPVDLNVPFDIKSLKQESMQILSSELIPETICGEVHKKSLWNKMWRPADCTSESLTKMGSLVSAKPISITKTNSHCKPKETVNGNEPICDSNVLKLWCSYIYIRPVRKDGDCFYRCFIFSYLEQVIARQDTYEEHRLLSNVKIVCRQHALLGLSSGFSRTKRAFKMLIKEVMRWKKSHPSGYRKQKLLEFFNNYQRSSYILAFLRLVAALFICSHSEEFASLVPELTQGFSLRDWCLTDISQMKVFIDGDIQIKALARALGVPLRLEYLFGERKDLYTAEHSKDDDVPISTCCRHSHLMSSDYEVPRVTLLFAEEQYYIIYPGLSSSAYDELNVVQPMSQLS